MLCFLNSLKPKQIYFQFSYFSMCTQEGHCLARSFRPDPLPSGPVGRLYILNFFLKKTKSQKNPTAFCVSKAITIHFLF